MTTETDIIGLPKLQSLTTFMNHFMKNTIHLIKRVIVTAVIATFSLGPALSASAQGIFEAHLSTPTEGGAELSTGKFWLQVTDGRADFHAIVYGSPDQPPSGFDPVMSIPGGSVEFSLSEGAFAAFHGLYTIADRNPYLPFEPPWIYDEEGNQYLIDAHVIKNAWVFSGQFELPADFEDQLIAGLGTVELSSLHSGTISLVAVPEPSTVALTLAAAGLWLASVSTARRRDRLSS